MAEIEKNFVHFHLLGWLCGSLLTLAADFEAGLLKNMGKM